MQHNTLHICLIAGEASGDYLGSQLIKSLTAKTETKIIFSGIGGKLMQEQGLTSLFPIENLSVMGIAEIVPRIPMLLKRIHQTSDHILTSKPDMVVTIDSPDFSFRVMKRLNSNQIKSPIKVHYVAPTVWAWRPDRAKKLASMYQGVICLYPFEPDFFTSQDMKAVFVGHPALEQLLVEQQINVRQTYNIDPDNKVLGVMFGSRIGELNRIGPILRQAVIKILESCPKTEIIAPTLPHLKEQVENLLHELPCKAHCVVDPDLKWSAFKSMDCAMAVSGTVGLELAIAGVPHVIGYKINTLTWLMVRNKIKINYAHMANILLNESVVPEFIQDKCKAENIAQATYGLLHNEIAAKQQINSFNKVRTLMRGKGTSCPSDQAAEFLLDLLYFRSSIEINDRRSDPV